MFSLFSKKPQWSSDNEEKALKAVSGETDPKVLEDAAYRAVFYTVRAAAFEKLGKHDSALKEKAVNCKAESECLDAVSEIGSDEVLKGVALNASFESVYLAAAGKIRNRSELKKLCSLVSIEKSSRKRGLLLFETGKLLKDPESCASGLLDIARENSSEMFERLDAVKASGLGAGTILILLRDPQLAQTLTDRYRGLRVTSSPDPALEKYCCPNGCLHDFEETRQWHDLGLSDDDDMKATKGYYEILRKCRSCGFSDTYKE